MDTNTFKITLHTSKGQFEELVSGESIELGRNISADLPVMASGVSRSHLKVYVKGPSIMIKDLGSTNGTYIKGERIEPHKELEYSTGTRISLGQAGCFVRIETVEQEVKIEDVRNTEITYSGKRAPEITHVGDDLEDKGLLESLFGTTRANEAQERKMQKRTKAHMVQADKLVKQRISEAEASIRKGIQKARIQAKDIKNEARKEAEIINSKAQVDRNQMLAEMEDEMSAHRAQILKEINEERLQSEKELASKRADLESEINLAQNEIKKNQREAEALVKGAKKEVEDLETKKIKLNDEIKDFLERKNTARQTHKEIEIKLSTIDERHQAKAEALDLELRFVTEELAKQKEKLSQLQEDQKQEELEASDRLAQLSEDFKNLEQKHEETQKEHQTLSDEILEFQNKSEDLKIQFQHKSQEFSELKKDLEQSLHERDSLEDSIVKTREEAERKLDAYQSQVETSAKKTTTAAQKEAKKIILEAQKEEVEALAKRDEILKEAKEEAKATLDSATDQEEATLQKNQERIERAKEEACEIHAAAQKTLENAEIEKENFLKESKDLKDQAQNIKSEAKKAADLKIKEAHEKGRKAFENLRQEGEDLVLKAKKQKEEVLVQAKTEKADYIRKAKERYEKTESDYESRMKELEAHCKKEKADLSEFIKDKKESEKSKLEKELAEYKVSQTREIEKEIDEQKRILDTYRADYAESWSQSIVFKAQELFGADMTDKKRAECRDQLKVFSKNIIMEKDHGEEMEIQGIMKFDPAVRERKIKFFKRTAVFAAMGLFALMVSPYVMKSIKEKAQQVAENSAKASEERVAKFEEEREKLKTFHPEKQNAYLENYTDRVLYTANYVENELSKDYRENWFLDLDTFFVEELILSDETIVTFISKETNLIKDLTNLRDNINAQFVDEGVERMRELEGNFLADVKELLKNEEKFEKFQGFKKETYLQAFPFGVDRSLANTPGED